MTDQFFDKESLVKNFLSADKESLMKMSFDNGYHFLEEEILYIQTHLRYQKKALPTYNQLDFFNEISKIRQREKTNFTISSVATDSPEQSIILDTAKDLLEKKNVCQEKLFGPTPLSFASLTASKYLKYIGCAEEESIFTPSDKTTQSSYFIHTNDGIPLFSLSDSDSQKSGASPTEIPVKNAIAILSPRFEMSKEEYKQNAENFFSSYAGQYYIDSYRPIADAWGLFGILVNEKDGILVNLTKVPEIEKDEDEKISCLTSLLSDCNGHYVFNLDPVHSLILNQAAEEYGLSVNSFAIRDGSGLFSLVRLKSPAFCFKTDFLLDLINFNEPKKYVFTNEKNESIGSKNPVFLTSRKSNEKHTYSAEKVLMFTKVVANATSRNLKNSPYKTSAIATLDAINALVAKGVAKDTVKLSIQYSLRSQTDDSLELGKNFASILGAYRTMIELCISDFDPQIKYSSAKRTITVVASAKTPIKKVKSNFAESESYIYFLPICYDSDGTPDYEKYRYSLKYFYLLFEKDTILSSFAINENISSILFSAAQKNDISFFEDITSDEIALSRGILFETYAELPAEDGLILIGKNCPSTTIGE